MTAASAEGSKSNAAMGGPDSPEQEESTGSKKVVRVVRRVVRRVVPTGTEEQSQPTSSTPAPGTSLTKTKAAGDEKDDLSAGLTSLMGRVRTKEHRPRTRTQDRKEDAKEEVKQQEVEEKGKIEEEERKPAVEKQEEVSSVSATPNPVPPKANPLSPPAGFIPPPKANPLAPPAGFIPAPKQNPLTPPPGFIPAKVTSPAPPKQNLLARPPGFIPLPKSDPLAPPAGFIPKPRLFAVKKPEVQSVQVHVSLFPCAARLIITTQKQAIPITAP